jgi:Eukaryotic aspartyl protease
MAKATKKAAKKVRRILSAAVALGGKMSATTVRLPITNVYMDGDYTGTIYVGSQNKPVKVILDTGSSTLAIDGTFYDARNDKTAKITDIAQEVGYADGSDWVGAVILVDVTLGSGSRSLALPQVHAAVAYHASSNMFRNSQGILGLAYTKLNGAFVMPGPTIPPKYTFNQIQAGQVTYIEPYFTQLESAGLVANKFAFYTLRSMINMGTGNPATDPLNNGFLILGGGEENTDLYSGSFQVARVVHDLYYNTNLKSITVGNTSPISVSPPTKASGNVSNSVVDSGTNSLLLSQNLFDAVAEKFSSAADSTLTDAIRAGYVPMGKLDLSAWPPITFVLEGALGTDVSLVVTPDTYWQTNSPKPGYATAVLFGDNGQGGGQSILGLPLLNNYFTVFDRSVDKGLGVVSFAKIK